MIEYPYIYVSSRTGHFNLAKPHEESVSTHIEIRDQQDNMIIYCNITTDHEVDDNGTNNVMSLIRYYLKSILWSSSVKEIQAMLDYMTEHDYDLTLGNWQHDLRVARAKRDRLDSEIADIERYLSGRGYFEKGMWVE